MTNRFETPFAQRLENVGLPDHVYLQVDKLERELAAARESLKLKISDLSACAEKIDAANLANMCDACGGTGKPISGLPCMCKGTGKMSVAALYLREKLEAAHNVASEKADDLAANQQAVTALEQRNAEVKIRQAAEKNLAAANQRAERAEKELDDVQEALKELQLEAVELTDSLLKKSLSMEVALRQIADGNIGNSGSSQNHARAALKAQDSGEGKC